MEWKWNGYKHENGEWYVTHSENGGDINVTHVFESLKIVEYDEFIKYAEETDTLRYFNNDDINSQMNKKKKLEIHPDWDIEKLKSFFKDDNFFNDDVPF